MIARAASRGFSRKGFHVNLGVNPLYWYYLDMLAVIWSPCLLLVPW